MAGFAGERLACERGARIVFSQLDFAVSSGGALVLTGPNGSGKSSLLRMMAGLVAPIAGSLMWSGEDIRIDPLAHDTRLRFVAHADAIKPALTVFENLKMWAVLAGRDEPATTLSPHARCERALDAVGLAGLSDIPGRYLSAGQRRRLALARLLVSPARLWLLDEPRTALDADGQARLDAAIAAHRASGGIVVVSLHGSPYPDAAGFLDLAEYQATETC